MTMESRHLQLQEEFKLTSLGLWLAINAQQGKQFQFMCKPPTHIPMLCFFLFFIQLFNGMGYTLV